MHLSLSRKKKYKVWDLLNWWSS